jgi:hypothetical protein
VMARPAMTSCTTRLACNTRAVMERSWVMSVCQSLRSECAVA